MKKLDLTGLKMMAKIKSQKNKDFVNDLLKVFMKHEKVIMPTPNNTLKIDYGYNYRISPTIDKFILEFLNKLTKDINFFNVA